MRQDNQDRGDCNATAASRARLEGRHNKLLRMCDQADEGFYTSAHHELKKNDLGFIKQ